MGILVAVLIVIAVGLAALALRAQGRLTAAQAHADLAEGASDDARRRQEDLEERARRAEERARTERGARARAERSGAMEREWARELRSQIAQLHRRAGALGEASPRELVLTLAMELLDADRGLLLLRADRDGDGRLDLVCAQGFAHDPEGSAVVQRLAQRSLRTDETLRDDHPEVPDDAEATEADREIRTLVALPVVLADELSGILVCANRPGGFEELDDDVLLALGDHAGAVLDNGRLRGELRSALLATVRVLAAAIEARDPPLRGHGDDVARLVARVAAELDVPEERREPLLVASMLHDVGKLAVPEAVLGKPGPLDDAERRLVERHPAVGRRLVEHVPALRVVAPAIGHHHERYDGTGYPDGLAGEAIPLEARIIGVADAWSAMLADRPYRAGLAVPVARAELEGGAGTHFDPEVVRAFLAAVADDPDGVQDRGLTDGALREALEAGVGTGGTPPPSDVSALDATDPVTLLRSHRHLHEAAALLAWRAGEGGAPFAVVAVRLTALAARNREASFAAGDEDLRRVAAGVERLAAARPGAVAARLGGATVALLWPAIDGEEPVVASEAVAAAVGTAVPVATGAARWEPGDAGHAVIDRASAAARAAAGAVRA